MTGVQTCALPISRETKIGFGFLLAGIAIPYLIDKLFGPIAVTIIFCFCLVVGIYFLISAYMHRDSASTFRSTKASILRYAVVALFIMGVTSSLSLVAWRLIQSRRIVVPAPAPPIGVTATTSDEVPLNYNQQMKKLNVSRALTPCTLKHGKTYFFDSLGTMPGGPNLKRPWIVAKPLRVLFENRSIADDPQLSTPSDSYDLLFEISVTSRGEPTVAKDWSLCMVHEGKPFFYTSQKVLPSDVESYEDKVSLEQATAAAPIERGHLVAGWISFRVPKDVIQEFVGSIEYRDYLEKRYFTGFVTTLAVQQSAP